MRPRLTPLGWALSLCLILVPAGLSRANDAGADFSLIQTQGTKFVDESGEPVTLKGCNVGNWLLLEMWMLTIDHGQFHDQYDFENNLADRFGEQARHELMELYRENWITPRDFEIIKSFGFNTIRLPFNYRLLEDDAKPFELKPDAFKWLDRAVEMAEDAGIYIILDMHGVPGGQSIDHPTGRVEQNKLWSDPVYGQRTAWLWKQIAHRYRDHDSIAGYDVINEPYNDFGGDIRPQLKRIFSEIYASIREVDDRHVIFAPAPLWGGHGFYGKPADNGWTNVAFTEHHYPGLFGSDPSLYTHGDFTNRVLPEKQHELDQAQAPMFIGEWNPVFENLGGGDLMRHYFDQYASRGWAATIWSYKILHNAGGVTDNNWYMVSNANPLDKPDFKTASREEIEDYFRGFATMEYVIDEHMRHALTRTDPVRIDFPDKPPAADAPPHTDELTGWTATDIGNAITGGQQIHSDTAMTIYGGGRDIWDRSDSFRFVWQNAPQDFTASTTLISLKETNVYAKAGLMLRSSLEPDAALVMIHAFPSGNVALGFRPTPGEPMQETQNQNHAWPIHLRLTRRGNHITGEYSIDGQTWTPVDKPVTLNAPTTDNALGLAVLSHAANHLTTARFEQIRAEGHVPGR